MRFSKIAITISGLYVLGAVGLFIKELSCQGWGCGIILVFPIMPWPLLFMSGGYLDSHIGFFILVIFNALIFYFIVYLIESGIRRIKNKHEA